ncbi:MAG: FAD-dependent oxidoreductase, partial [Candidatus Woesearchaeota archaeon]|nr:FAD-dependent oxidoreductase [Candidatus Woesearchaeota archaeon]
MIKKSKDFFDAVVIGAGPSGCEIAYRLAKKGFKVIVLEKENLNREKPCGGGIQLQEILEFGIPKKAIERKIRRARVVFPDNRQI